nr:uncharacterized protein LOC129257671 [Lytechinus pictus]
MPNDTQASEGPLDRSFEDLVTKILATEEDCVTNDNLGAQISLTQELLDTLSAGNCFENGIPPWKQAAIPDISGVSSAQLIQEALNWMQQNKNGQMLNAESENTYTGSPHSSLAGSYSSGDEIGWPNIPLPRVETDLNPPCMNRSSPQIPQLDAKPTPYNYENQQQFNNMPPSREDFPFQFPPNRASPINMAEMMGVQKDPQLPSPMGRFNNGNNLRGSPVQSPPVTQPPISPSFHSQDDYPSQQPNFHQPFQRPPFNNPRDFDMSQYARAQQWKNQQDMFRNMTNPRFKYDAQMAAGFPRNNYNTRYPYSSRPSHVPGWVKRNQSLNMNIKQSTSFTENYASLPHSPMSPTSPILNGELAAAIEDCQYQLQNLEKERRKTETELVKMNPGKRISSSNTIAVPPLPPNPSALDQLIVEEYREHSRMTTLLSKIGGLNAKALHPNIEACLDMWMSAIQSVEAHRTAEMCQTLHGRNIQDKGDGSIVTKIKNLHQATSAARTKLWCALQLSKEKHIPPINKELLNFLPEMVRLI